MPKGITFTDSDKELVRAIEKYQQAKHLLSFVAAVRDLCHKGLTVQELMK